MIDYEYVLCLEYLLFFLLVFFADKLN